MGIKIYNLEKGEFEEEKVCAEGFMRFLYGCRAGNFLVWSLFKRVLFSRLCGLWADSRRSSKAVLKFIADNNINTDEMLYAPSNFKTFNEFFTRALAEGARPLADCDVSFPSDGRHLLVENVSESDTFYVKGRRFDLASFFGDAALAERFRGADMLISRLCPSDYHRFHYPISGEIAARKEISGSLFSVSPIALVPRLSVLWENKRILNMIESPTLGMCAFVEIGATNVGSIINFDKVGALAVRGAQAGMFNFGGSCVVTLIPKSANIKWNSTLREMSSQSVECYCKANTCAACMEK